ncbi:3-oxoacyl-[acyl-carrier-protein] synthase, putative [Talaromyces stipitatus ATCC 10500]|uniref:3-oxoacyl-[acyl-carrier-protein] synthase, putative n=1 Tax=Talaromyces stipitatus (strain ATCC 10500 / CBS 375.48 / QM 6759 / NRRL 1006) TaxID=441959 RepID=B8LV34_TALSN|nr:3-oxoacyl-[acyl-carrier-protein] synthase, putative [Talaromyces stipitatus ATCC 10500]EED22655.1 3-oxoacyl-[acyl-carrier-protein] synthase, putative [Talaromyces stipitatus ATCC 10500]
MASGKLDEQIATKKEVRGAKNKRAIAHTLLIELLSYQLSLPVRWIETQKQLFNAPESVRKYVEIGAKTTLATMVKRMADRQPTAEKLSKAMEFYSYSDQKSDLYYEYRPNAGISPQSSSQLEAQQSIPSPAATESSITNATISEAPVSAKPGLLASDNPTVHKRAVKAVPNLSPTHIVIALTAQKVNKAFDTLPMQKSIQELSGGKSTLQNELMGDLSVEFSSVPNGGEYMPLETLGEMLQQGFNGKPGKQMSTLISKFISRKMPPSFNQVTMQNYIETSWGFGKENSIIPICFAVTMEPATRFEHADSAKQFLDDVVNRLASFFGIPLSLQLSDDGSTSSAQSAIIVGSSALDRIRQEQRNYHLEEFNRLSDHLKIDCRSSDKLQNLISSTKAMEDKLNRWATEFDENFFDGIGPLFDPKKTRNYDSSWNWIREETIRIFNQFSLGHIDYNDQALKLISRKWDSSCVQIAQDFLQKIEKVDPEVTIKARGFLRLESPVLGLQPVYRYSGKAMMPLTYVSSTTSNIEYKELPREVTDYVCFLKQGRITTHGEAVPYVHLRRRQPANGEYRYNAALTRTMMDMFELGSSSGLSFATKTILVTGAGPKSIGSGVVEGLLNGGAKVIVTTSRDISTSADFFANMYRKHGAHGSSLTVIPFNQGSRTDCEDLVKYIYGADSPVGGDVDYIVPFGAIPEKDNISNLGSMSELAHRVMLTNVLRIVGLVYQNKKDRRIDSRPTNVIIPLSFNKGGFGGDGLYPESKLGLESLFNRFYSGNWQQYITITGAVIGWVRETSLSQTLSLVGYAIEQIPGLNVCTFSRTEMAFNILTLMTPAITELAEDHPLYADLTGGAKEITNIKDIMSDSRSKFTTESNIRRALFAEKSREQNVLGGAASSVKASFISAPRVQRSNLNLQFPVLSSHADLTGNISGLEGMIDLARTPVVVGYSELGPWGNARTRWDVEHLGDFTLETYVEMAWILGLVKHYEGEINGQVYVGWVDSKTKEPVCEDNFKQLYGDHIKKHSGIRFIEPELLNSYDPAKKEFLQEIVVEEDLPSFATSEASADAFKLRFGNKVSIEPVSDSEECRVTVHQGAHFMLPKSVPFDRAVAGLLPSGWDPLRYGIPEDIVQQVDPVTLYTLCCVSEALLSAGISDPYEFYNHIHVSELTNCIGTGAGAMLAGRGLYRDRFLDRPVQSDILSESFLNTTAAWVNMLLFSASGPIKTPVGACATAIESLEMGCEAIKTGKSKVAIVGGYDDFQEEASYEFAMMKATVSSEEELAKGRRPEEMSRPSTTTRSGFVESAGCGVQIVMNAELAIKMGLPIYAVVAYSQIAADQNGRSIPAPGQGILTAARERTGRHYSKLLDLSYRRKLFDEDIAAIDKWWQEKSQTAGLSETDLNEIQALARSKIRQAQYIWGNDIRSQDPLISPMRAALATWGLTVDDIQVTSMHGTSTNANDTNEAQVINEQMKHLGRRPGNPLLAVCQKSLTGHPKGAAGAWQMNGCMQMIQNGIVPGNRNADNIEIKLKQNTYIVYPKEAIQVREIKATMLTSFGFGQKGGLVIAVASRYLYSAVAAGTYEEYRQKATRRQRAANSVFISGVIKNSLVRLKDQAPWGKSDEKMRKVFLDPASIEF